MSAPRLYTIAEAAEATGLSHKAIRGRVDRGQLSAVKSRDGLRRIPHSELDRAGLLRAAGAAKPAPLGQLPRQGGPDGAEAISMLLRRLEEQAAEIGQLRQLTKQAESLREDRDRLEAAVHEERARAQQLQEVTATAEAALVEERARAATAEAQVRAAQEQAEDLRKLAESSWWTRRKLHRLGAPGTPAGATAFPLART